MIRHCSLFKLKAGTSEQVRDEIVHQFRTLPGRVSSIVSADIGENIGFHDDNYDIAATVTFRSLDGYREYAADETHLAFVDAYLMPNLESRVAVQFNLGDE
jgi:hypothetical protein